MMGWAEVTLLVFAVMVVAAYIAFDKKG